MTRRDKESMFGRFWKYADTKITLTPIDEKEPRLGGRVSASQKAFDIRTFTFSSTYYQGVYGEDFLAFGQFHKDVDPSNEATLLKIFEDGSEEVIDRHFFKFENQKVTYSRSVNGNHKDTDIEH